MAGEGAAMATGRAWQALGRGNSRHSWHSRRQVTVGRGRAVMLQLFPRQLLIPVAVTVTVFRCDC